MRSLVYRGLVMVMALMPVYGLDAFGFDSRAENEALAKWRSTAKSTYVGLQLVQLLDATGKAIQYNANDKASLYRRAYLLGIVGCTQSAIDDLDRALKVDPCYAPAYTERAICYMDLKDFNKALFDLNQAVQLNPRSGDALYARGRLHLLMGKPMLALSDLRRCESGDVKFSTVLPGELPANSYDACEYYLGSCYEAMDRPDEAIRHYNASIKSPHLGMTGFLHRYADQPLDTKWRISSLQGTGY